MSTLFTGILSGFFKSYVFDLPEVSRGWFVGKRILFHAAALLIYAFALIVAMIVFATVAFIAYPVSQVYKVFS